MPGMDTQKSKEGTISLEKPIHCSKSFAGLPTLFRKANPLRPSVGLRVGVLLPGKIKVAVKGPVRLESYPLAYGHVNAYKAHSPVFLEYSGAIDRRPGMLSIRGIPMKAS
jgi:hypothetical protein